jgi:hypothetical protein
MIDIDINSDAFLKGLNAKIVGIETCIGATVKDVVFSIDAQLHKRTPVHSGQAVRNMIWSVGQGGASAQPAIEDPVDTGRTSQMELGQEPRRAANEAAARESLAALSFKDPFQVFVLENASPDIGLIENGSSGSPGKSRAPAGVFVITIAEVMARLKTGNLG